MVLLSERVASCETLKGPRITPRGPFAFDSGGGRVRAFGAAAAVEVLQLEGLANAAAVDAAIDALCTTQEAAGNALREMASCKLMIGGVARDVLFLLFTDGAPPVS